MTLEQKQLIMLLKESGKGGREIAKELNIPKSTVFSYLQSVESNNLCPNCGEPITNLPGFHRLRKYCSDKCRYDFNHMKKRKSVFTCKQCGKSFSDYKHIKRSFCSRSCFHAYQKETCKKNIEKA